MVGVSVGHMIQCILVEVCKTFLPGKQEKTEETGSPAKRMGRTGRDEEVE